MTRLANVAADRPPPPSWRERIASYFFGDDVFISYARRDGVKYAQALARAVNERGLSFYLDQWSVTIPGADLPAPLRTALRRSSLLVIVGTEAAQQSAAVESEIVLFADTQRKIIPISFDGLPTRARWYGRIEGLPIANEPAEAFASATPSKEIIDDIDQSMLLNRRSRRLRRSFNLTLFATLAIAAIAAMIVLIASLQLRDVKRQADEQMAIAQSRRIANQAAALLRQGRLDSALLLAAEASKSASTYEAREVLLAGINERNLRMFIHDAGPDIAMTADGKLLFVAHNSAEDGDPGIAVWNLETGQQLPTPSEIFLELKPTKIAVAADGSTVAAADGEQLVLWSRATGAVKRINVRRHPPDMSDSIEVMTFSQDGRMLGIGSTRGVVAAIDVQAGSLTTLVHTSTADITGLAISPDSKRVLFVDRDGDLHEVGLSGEAAVTQKRLLDGDEVKAAAFSPDLSRLLILRNDDKGQVNVWNLATSQREDDIDPEVGSVAGITVSGDGETLVIRASSGEVTLWNMKSRSRNWELPKTYSNGFSSVVVSRDSNLIATVGKEGRKILVWDQTTLNLSIGSAVYRPSGKFILAVSRSGRLFAIRNETSLVLERSDGGAPIDLGDAPLGFAGGAFSPDERLLVTSDDDEQGKLHFWDCESGIRVGDPVAGHSSGTRLIRFSPDGRRFVSGGNDGRVAVWKTAARKRDGPDMVHGNTWLTALTISADGRLAASAGADRTVRIWNLNKRVQVTPKLEIDNYAYGLAFSRDGGVLTATDEFGGIYLWNTKDGRQLYPTMTIGASGYLLPTFSPDGGILFLAGRSRRLAMWDVDARQALSTPISWTDPIDIRGFGGDPLPAGIQDSCNGKCTLIWSSDGSIIRWSIDPNSWLNRARQIANRNLTRVEFLLLFGPNANYRATFPDLPLPPAGDIPPGGRLPM
jgi:WD40 repeat protein